MKGTSIILLWLVSLICLVAFSFAQQPPCSDDAYWLKRIAEYERIADEKPDFQYAEAEKIIADWKKEMESRSK